jgi:hypothetical protein
MRFIGEPCSVAFKIDCFSFWCVPISIVARLVQVITREFLWANLRPMRMVLMLPALLLAAASVGGETQQFLSQSNDGTFYFHGTIDQTLEIAMVLKKHGKQLDGGYMYASHRKIIPLKGETRATAEYQLEELAPAGRVTGHFKLNELAGAGHPFGTWESADGKRKLTVVLGEITSAQHELLLRLWETKPQIVALSVGANHSCVMRTLSASCWGVFSYMPTLATSGPGMVTQRALPNLLIDQTIMAVATSSRRLCVLQSGSLRCAQPDDPKLPMRDLTLIPGFDRDVTMIGASERYSCAVVSSALKCWDGSSLSPSSVIEIISSGIDRLSSGAPQCAVTATGGVKCWSIEYQQDKQQNRLIVQDVTGLNGEIRSLSSAGFDEQHFACAVDAQGLKCWGNNFARPLGSRPGGVRNLPPAPIAGLETGVTAVATELSHSCAVKEGKVYCWGGHNYLGELGERIPQALGDVVEVNGVENATQIGVGPGYSCALTNDLRVLCWGDNEFGQTGNTSHDVCKQPNGRADAIEIPCNRHPVEVRGLRRTQ